MGRQFLNEGTEEVLAQCSKCKVFLPLSSYHRASGRKYNIKSYCIECTKKAYPPEHIRVVRKAWEDSTGYREKRRQEYSPEKNRAQKLRLTYNMSVEDYDKMFQEQEGLCAICLCSPQGDARLAVDHDHACCPGTKSCGKCIRKLLCSSCNNGLGRFRDNEILLQRAIDYLKEF